MMMLFEQVESETDAVEAMVVGWDGIADECYRRQEGRGSGRRQISLARCGHEQ